MAGTVIITGANGSLAIPAVEQLLIKHPTYTVVLTVRNISDCDDNTTKLRRLLAHHPNIKAYVHELDLSGLRAVHNFASSIIARVSDGKLPPLAGIICNAYYWNLVRPAEITEDGYDKSLQVSHLAHVALVLRLLGSFRPEGGRVVLFSSDAHWPGKNSLEKYPPVIPNNLELLIKPTADEPVDNFGRGFQRYAVAKLVVVMWMYALNKVLEKDPNLSNITAVAINPGNLSDSRALRTNTPNMLYYLSKYIIQPLRPILRLMDPTMRTSAEAGSDIIGFATNEVYPNERGYFTMLEKDESSPDSRDQEKQQALFQKSVEWAKVKSVDTAIKVEF